MPSSKKADTPRAGKPGARGAPRAAAQARPARPRATSRRTAARPARIVRAKPESLRLRSIAASFTVADLERSLFFYTKALGFIVHQRWETDGKLDGVTLRAGTCELNLSQDDWSHGRDRLKGVGMRLWLETVQDLDRLAERAEGYGASITEWPADRPWGVRSFSLDDLDGYHLSFYRPL